VKLEKSIEITVGDKTAVEILHETTDLSRQVIKQAMRKGAVWLKRNRNVQRIRRADRGLQPGDNLYLYYDDRILQQQPASAILIADEGLYSIWYKPYGMLSQGSKWGDHCTINRWVEDNLKPQRPAFIVHRLDRAATGLMIIAHQKKTAACFAGLFERRQVDKHYQAIVHGCFPDRKTISLPVNNKPATSHVKCLGYDAGLDRSLLEVSIETGRKHQIRRHLSESGFPIVGDRLYGEATGPGEKDLCLASCFLSFPSPPGGVLKTYHLPEKLLPGL